MACTRSPASGPFITSKTNTFSNCSWPIEISGPLKEQKLQGLTGGPQFIQAFKSGRNNYVKKYVLALEQSVLNTSQNFDILDLLEIQSLLWTLLWSRNCCVFNLSTKGWEERANFFVTVGLLVPSKAFARPYFCALLLTFLPCVRLFAVFVTSG